MTSLVNINNTANFPNGWARLLVEQYPDTYQRNRMEQQTIHSASDWDPGYKIPIDGGSYHHNGHFDRDRTARPTATWLNEITDGRLHTHYAPVSTKERLMYGDNADSILLYRSRHNHRPLW